MFDSLGKDVKDYPDDIKSFTERFGKATKIFTERLQPPNTSLCGHYCLYYAYMRCKGQEMESIISNIPSAMFIRTYVTYLYNIPDVILNYHSCVNC